MSLKNLILEPFLNIRNLIAHFLSKLSLRFRLTVVTAIVFGLTLTILGSLTFRYFTRTLQEEFDIALYNYAVDVSTSITITRRGDIDFDLPQVDKQKIYPFSFGTALIQIRHIDGVVLTREGEFGHFDLPFVEEFDLLKRGQEVVFSTIYHLEELPGKEADSYRVINFPIDENPQPQLILQIAVPRTLRDAQIRSEKLLLQIGIPISVILIFVLGLFISSRALAPVKNMIAKAQQIETQDLSLRLPVPQARDEIRDLAETLNEMLSRLEAGFRSQERFVADASHQLKTPLTLLKMELEQDLRRPTHASTPDSSVMTRSLLSEVNQMIRLTENMLLLAQVESGLILKNFREIFLDDVLIDVLSRVEKLTKARGIRIHFNIHNKDAAATSVSRWAIAGDEVLLQQMFFNLIENAIKYSPENQSISIEHKIDATTQSVEIRDHGPGLPNELKDHLFNRFSRGSSTSRIPGYGLGLSIAFQIARLHQGNLSAVSFPDAASTANLSALPDSAAVLTGCLFKFEIKKI